MSRKNKKNRQNRNNGQNGQNNNNVIALPAGDARMATGFEKYLLENYDEVIAFMEQRYNQTYAIYDGLDEIRMQINENDKKAQEAAVAEVKKQQDEAAKIAKAAKKAAAIKAQEDRKLLIRKRLADRAIVFVCYVAPMMCGFISLVNFLTKTQ